MAWVGIEPSLGRRTCAVCGNKIRPKEHCLHMQAAGAHYPVKVNLCWMCVLKFNEELLFQQCKQEETIYTTKR